MSYKFIHTEYLESVSGGDKEIIQELYGMFRDQVTEIVIEMRSLYGKGDYHSLGMLAHKAKSSVAIMGMSDLSSMIKNFEMEGKEGKNKEKYIPYIDRYEEECLLAVGELKDFINNL
jgi:HPt (histidine-containing phosphotransfer) domain-containing protein